MRNPFEDLVNASLRNGVLLLSYFRKNSLKRRLESALKENSAGVGSLNDAPSQHFSQ